MLVYGKNVLKELLDNNINIKKAFVYKNNKNIDLLNKLKCEIKYLEKNELDKMVNGLHQGIILDIEDYKYYDLDTLGDKIVMLDHIEDPHNLGAIIRTCLAAGIDSIIIPKDRSVLVNGTVMKTSAGFLSKIKIACETNLVNTIKYLKNKGYWVIGTDFDGTDYKELDYSGKIIIVIGNEGKGISKLVKENCDFIATIPMKNNIESLNASVAASIIIFETVRKG